VTGSTVQPAEGFRHEAIFYTDEHDFVDHTGSFIAAGVAKDEPILVVVSARKIDLLQRDLGSDARKVTFADMEQVGQNPARIIPVWRDFVSDHVAPGHAARGVGEPIWAARTPDELVECERHEALLNLAFAGSAPWQLACPYDATALAPEVIKVAKRNHPFVANGQGATHNPEFPGTSAAVEASSTPLPEPEHVLATLQFGDRDLADIRATVAHVGAAFGFSAERQRDLVVAVSEVVTNSIRHGGGVGTLRLWATGDSLVCEIADRGLVADPLVGRTRPGTDQTSGFGLWLVHQLCDLVQLRTTDKGSVIRMHLAR
jgi:anti-sigma regulatory factor (Ser/Thr protein kinase)